MRQLLILSLFFGVFGAVFAQEDMGMELYLEALNHTPCETPTLLASSVIQYRQGAALFLQFDERPENLHLVSENGQLLSVSENTAYPLDESGKNYLVKWLPENKAYEVVLENTCKEDVVVEQISTNAQPFEQGIYVSDALNRVIRRYQKEGADGRMGTIADYLEKDNSVHFFEKVFFIQNYFHDRGKLSEFSDTRLPDAPKGNDDPDGPDPDPDGPGRECTCKFVLNSGQSASPIGIGSGNGIIVDDVYASEPERFGRHGNASTWNKTMNKGASKYHGLWTDACQAGTLEHEKTLTNQGDNVSGQYGRVSYNIVCTTFGYLSDCQCNDIEIRFYYHYNTTAGAYARLSNCGSWSKKAVAASQDIGTAFYVQDGDLNIVDAVDVRAQAECDKTVNPAFWQNLADVAIALAGIYIQSTGDNFSLSNDQIEDLSEDVSDLIGSPAFTSEGCNFEAIESASLFNGQHTLYLQPNKPIDFYVASNSDLLSGGRKSWHSYAWVVSDFYLAGVVLPFRDEDCCFEKQANWVFSGRGGSTWEHETVRQQLGQTLNHHSPWDLPYAPYSNAVQLPSDYGSTWYDMGACLGGGGITDGGTPQFRIGEENMIPDADVLQPYHDVIRLYSTTGHLLYHGENVPIQDLLDRNSFLGAKLPYTGIYLLEKVTAGKREVEKVFFNKEQ